MAPSTITASPETRQQPQKRSVHPGKKRGKSKRMASSSESSDAISHAQSPRRTEIHKAEPAALDSAQEQFTTLALPEPVSEKDSADVDVLSNTNLNDNHRTRGAKTTSTVCSYDPHISKFVRGEMQSGIFDFEASKSSFTSSIADTDDPNALMKSVLNKHISLWEQEMLELYLGELPEKHSTASSQIRKRIVALRNDMKADGISIATPITKVLERRLRHTCYQKSRFGQSKRTAVIFWILHNPRGRAWVPGDIYDLLDLLTTGARYFFLGSRMDCTVKPYGYATFTNADSARKFYRKQWKSEIWDGYEVRMLQVSEDELNLWRHEVNDDDDDAVIEPPKPRRLRVSSSDDDLWAVQPRAGFDVW